MKGKFTYVLSAIILSAAMTVLSSEGYSQQFVRAGITAGAQLTNMNSSLNWYNRYANLYGSPDAVYTTPVKSAGYKPVIGYNGGVTAEVGITEMFSTELDLLYSAMGAKRYFVDSLALYDRTYYYNYHNFEKLNYMQAHLLFKLNLNFPRKFIIPYDRPGDSRNFITLYAGPYFGSLLSHSRPGYDSLIARYNTGEFITKTVIYGKPDSLGLGSKDMGVTVGAGLNFYMGKGTYLSFDARYMMGLTSLDIGGYGKDVLKTDENGNNYIAYQTDEIKNSAIGFNIGLKWNIMSKD